MTKKEQAEMDELRNQLAKAKAFRFTEQANEDVMPPSGFEKLSTGWLFNAHSKRVDVACSSSTGHAWGQNDRTTTQQPRRLYSTKLLALKALRYELEQKFAAELAEVDKRIQEEESL
jgi:hypothetical protein